MKIQININPDATEDEIIIHCRRVTKELEQVVAALRAAEQKLIGAKNGQTYLLDAAQILYIDTIDRKVFLYTGNDVYETSLKLYVLEELLAAQDFFRAGKSSIVNLGHIQALRSDLDGRMLVTMDNGEKLVVSRQYAAAIKERLGV